MKLLAVALALSMAAADVPEKTINVPEDAFNKMVQENIELRKEVNKLEDIDDELVDKLKKQIGMVGTCT